MFLFGSKMTPPPPPLQTFFKRTSRFGETVTPYGANKLTENYKKLLLCWDKIVPLFHAWSLPSLIFLTLQQPDHPLSILTTRQHALGNIQILSQLTLHSSIFLQFSFCKFDYLATFLKSYCMLGKAFTEISILAHLRDTKTRDVHVHFVEERKSGKVSWPNFHNISNVETRETISSIHCRMKEYISKICLWNTMIKQEAAD